jgi:hypothetical protein
MTIMYCYYNEKPYLITTRNFSQLRDRCFVFCNQFVVLGGDWNTTVDGRPTSTNMDTIYMADIPSKRSSKWLKDLGTSSMLSDPYHQFYLDRWEFKYIF